MDMFTSQVSMTPSSLHVSQLGMSTGSSFGGKGSGKFMSEGYCVPVSGWPDGTKDEYVEMRRDVSEQHVLVEMELVGFMNAKTHKLTIIT